MIIELLLNVLFAFFKVVLSFIPSHDPPDLISDIPGHLQTIWGYGEGLGAWVPWSVIMGCITAVLVANVAGFGIKVTRMILSQFTGGGGSAA